MSSAPSLPPSAPAGTTGSGTLPHATPLPPGHRPGQSVQVPCRGLRYHVTCWGPLPTPEDALPPLVLVHGWMDVGASFQFLVDALSTGPLAPRSILAIDWRGFGRTDPPAGTDSYHFADYLGDLDVLLRAPALGLAHRPVIDLVGHSMGGNVAMLYAGIRPERIRRLVNLEGFGLPSRPASDAPRHYARWLNALEEPAQLRPYASLEAVAERLQKNNPRLRADRAHWLAPHWSRQNADGQWELLGDPAHKRPSPTPYRVDEVLATWRAITAPVLWVEGRLTDVSIWWGNRYPREEFEARLAEVPQLQRVLLEDCGHMLHHDQPERLARHLEHFLA